MTDQPNTSTGDVAYWGLTQAQAARYYRRLSRMHADITVRFAARAEEYARKATILSWIATALVALSLLLRVLSAVAGGS